MALRIVVGGGTENSSGGWHVPIIEKTIKFNLIIHNWVGKIHKLNINSTKSFIMYNTTFTSIYDSIMHCQLLMCSTECRTCRATVLYVQRHRSIDDNFIH